MVWCVREGGCGEKGKTEGVVREGGLVKKRKEGVVRGKML